jgi:hypothetical protein
MKSPQPTQPQPDESDQMLEKQLIGVNAKTAI